MENAVTINIFLGVTLGLFSIWLAIFLWCFTRISNALDKIKDALLPMSQISLWIQQKGLNKFFTAGYGGSSHKTGGNPLNLQQRERRDELLQKGNMEGLYSWEAKELEDLLRQEAQDDFAKGILNFVAFLGILALIKSLADSLKKREEIEK